MALEIPEDLNEFMRAAPWVVVFTGAGVSAESGIPTFRDALTGYWAKYQPEDLATPEAFYRDPATVSKWYDQRRATVAECLPNPGHLALARMQEQMTREGRSFTLITQNVDRLHQAAGSKDVIELHGTLWVWRCVRCGKEVEERGEPFGGYPPRCTCGGNRRPGVVWFGEELPEKALLAARRAAGKATLFLSVGTSAVVYPAAGLIDVAVGNGAKLCEINPDATAASDSATWVLRGRSGEVLPELLKGMG